MEQYRQNEQNGQEVEISREGILVLGLGGVMGENESLREIRVIARQAYKIKTGEQWNRTFSSNVIHVSGYVRNEPTGFSPTDEFPDPHSMIAISTDEMMNASQRGSSEPFRYDQRSFFGIRIRSDTL